MPGHDQPDPCSCGVQGGLVLSRLSARLVLWIKRMFLEKSTEPMVGCGRRQLYSTQFPSWGERHSSASRFRAYQERKTTAGDSTKDSNMVPALPQTAVQLALMLRNNEVCWVTYLTAACDCSRKRAQVTNLVHSANEEVQMTAVEVQMRQKCLSARNNKDQQVMNQKNRSL
jgi:hypothetical protein